MVVAVGEDNSIHSHHVLLQWYADTVSLWRVMHCMSICVCISMHACTTMYVHTQLYLFPRFMTALTPFVRSLLDEA